MNEWCTIIINSKRSVGPLGSFESDSKTCLQSFDSRKKLWDAWKIKKPAMTIHSMKYENTCTFDRL